MTAALAPATTSRIVSLIAVPYEDPTIVTYRQEAWREVFSRDAFAGVDPNSQRIPVTACTAYPPSGGGHDGGRVVGRMITARSADPRGLVLGVRVAATPLGDEVLGLLEDGGLWPSVGFACPAGGQSLDRRTMTRRIRRAVLDHVAFVAQPAYGGTRILSTRASTPPPDLSSDPVFAWAEMKLDPTCRWAERRRGGR